MHEKPLVLDRIDAATQVVRQWKQSGRRVSLVPTMGALHEGHLSLVRQSAAQAECTVVTIFVNPTQFGPQEDYQKYPRQLERDLELLASCDLQLVVAPSADQLYRPGHSTFVEPPAVARPWEGACRPGHFRGVATIVLKLLQIVPADSLLLGQKDYQQYRVVQDMVADLNVPVEVRACPTVRDPDGLALSSRNAYLSGTERLRALGLVRALRTACREYSQGQRAPQLLEESLRRVLGEHEVHQIDYAVVVDGHTLEVPIRASDGCVALVAARVGQTRLIDNMRLVEGT
jgi:pantoate--beta-alanine ligase